MPCPSSRGGTQPEPDAEGENEGEENDGKEETNDDSPSAGDTDEGEENDGKEGTNDDSPSAEGTNDDSPSTLPPMSPSSKATTHPLKVAEGVAGPSSKGGMLRADLTLTG